VLCCALSSKAENVASRREITEWSAVEREGAICSKHIFFAFQIFPTALCTKSENASRLARGTTAY
jgi:hypothetical protein